MKKFQDVETLKNLQANSTYACQSIHRSSLIVPNISGSLAGISFLNHFMLKRNIPSVALKVTAYSTDGLALNSKTFFIDSLRVYFLNLSQLFPYSDTSCFEVEFFSASDLGVPFPAVIVNHFNNNFHNVVHSYNRILNDSREDSEVRNIHVREGAIDYVSDNDHDTFFVYQTALLDSRSQNDNTIKYSVSGHLPNLPSEEMSIALENTKKMTAKIIKFDFCMPAERGDISISLSQPDQPLFFGRLLCGTYCNSTQSFSANHSYYDNSSVLDFSQSGKCGRTYPYFHGISNQLIFYPILSPGQGIISVIVHYVDSKAGKLESILIFSDTFINDQSTLRIDISNLLAKVELQGEAKTFTVIYEADKPNSTGCPSRVNHQLVYGNATQSKLLASINVSLINDSFGVDIARQRSFAWIQLLNKSNYTTKCGLCFTSHLSDSIEEHGIQLDYYSENGLIKSEEVKLRYCDSLLLDNSWLEDKDGEYIWVVAKSEIRGLSMYTVHSNNMTRYASGEHNF